MYPAPGLEHQRISGRLFLAISTSLTGKQCELFAAPFDVRLRREDQSGDDQKVYTVVQPDLCLICNSDILDERGCLGAPDLIIEILSPGNSKKELKDKFQLYEEVGVKEYWMVYPEQKSISMFILDEEGIYKGLRPLSEEERLTSILLPQLSFLLAAIFSSN